MRKNVIAIAAASTFTVASGADPGPPAPTAPRILTRPGPGRHGGRCRLLARPLRHGPGQRQRHLLRADPPPPTGCQP